MFLRLGSSSALPHAAAKWGGTYSALVYCQLCTTNPDNSPADVLITMPTTESHSNSSLKVFFPGTADLCPPEANQNSAKHSNILTMELTKSTGYPATAKRVHRNRSRQLWELHCLTVTSAWQMWSKASRMRIQWEGIKKVVMETVQNTSMWPSVTLLKRGNNLSRQSNLRNQLSARAIKLEKVTCLLVFSKFITRSCEVMTFRKRRKSEHLPGVKIPQPGTSVRMLLWPSTCSFPGCCPEAANRTPFWPQKQWSQQSQA